jgi:hypothetical protein
MTLEVRQLVLKSTIGADDDDIDDERRGKPNKGPLYLGVANDDETRERLKNEILAECQTLLLAYLQQLRER